MPLVYSTILALIILNSISNQQELAEPNGPPAPPPNSEEGTINSSDSNSTILPLGPTSIPINDGSLGEPIVVGRDGSLNSDETPPSPPAEGRREFPKPAMGLPKMIEKAKVRGE